MSTERGSRPVSGSPRLAPCTCVAWVDDLVQATSDSAPGPPLQNKGDVYEVFNGGLRLKSYSSESLESLGGTAQALNPDIPWFES